MIVIFPTLIEKKSIDFKTVGINITEFIKRVIQLKSSIIPLNEWQCDTFTTINTEYDFLKDPVSEQFITVINKAVFDFASNYGDMTDKTIRCDSAWINVASSGNYQEYHNHTRSHFSAVYYLKVPPNSGNIVFRAYDHLGDMFPLPFDINTEKEPAFRTFYIRPEDSDLIIFRSSLEHMVQKNRNTEDRICIAMNFIVE